MLSLTNAIHTKKSLLPKINYDEYVNSLSSCYVISTDKGYLSVWSDNSYEFIKGPTNKVTIFNNKSDAMKYLDKYSVKDCTIKYLRLSSSEMIFHKGW